jgi:hypothetical protein
MHNLDRDLIIVVGNQGFGKSVWSKLFTKSKPRLLVFDPQQSYDVDFQTDPETWVPDILENGRKDFRFGSGYPWELSLLGNTAYASGDCTFLVEECALIFRRGEELHDWAKPIVFMGRVQRVSLVLIAQRASKIPMDIRSQASRIVTFRQTEPADVDALIDRMGSEAEGIPDLPVLTCLDWEDGNMSRYAIPKPA